MLQTKLKLHPATMVLVLSLTALGIGVLDLVLPAENPEKPPEVILAHQYPVHCVAFAPDGKILAAGGGFNETAGEVRLWDVATGAERARLDGHRTVVFAMAFAPAGQTLATASFGRVVKLWDVATACQRQSIDLPIPLAPSLTFSPDGQTLALGGWERGGSVKSWSLATGAERTLVTGSGPVAFNSDGQLLASAGQFPEWATAKIWNTATGKELFALRGHQDPVWSVAFSPDGRILASASMDKTIKLWDVATGTERLTLRGHTNQVLAVAFARNGTLLGSAGQDRTVRLWDPATGTERAIFHGHAGGVTSVAFSPDAQWVASGSKDRTVRLWPLPRRKL